MWPEGKPGSPGSARARSPQTKTMTPNKPLYVVATLRQWVLHLGLWPRMALAISLGFLALFATFAILGERALQDSTDRLLKERLVIAQMAARQLDERLQQATAQLQQAQRFVGFDPANPDRSAEAHVLAVISTREGLFSAIVFLDPSGRVVLSIRPTAPCRTPTCLDYRMWPLPSSAALSAYPRPSTMDRATVPW